MNKHHLMVNGSIPPGEIYTLRKEGEVKVTVKTIKALGGPEGIAQRLIALWLELPEHYQARGWGWYDEAHEFAKFLAEVYGYTVWQTAQVISVLSPQNPWFGKISKNGKRQNDGNRLCAVKVIDAFFRGGPEEVLKLCTGHGWGYAGDFVRKAIRVLQGEELDWSGAPKTHRFAQLIFDPKREDIAVMDSHASRIATGNLGDKYHVVDKGAYPLLETGHMMAAGVLGIPAYVIQAGLWSAETEGEMYY